MNKSDQTLVDALRRLSKDAIDYFQSVITLLQARLAEMALSSIVFLLLLAFAALTGLGSFLFFNIAFGMWLTKILGSAFWSILTMGLLYAALAFFTGGIALRWLKQLKS